MRLRSIMPTMWLLLALLLMVALHFLLPGMIALRAPWSLFGLLPVAAGLIINTLADRAFHLAHTTVKPFQESSALVTTGVFGFTRNPMYLGFVLALAGAAWLLGSLTPWLVIPPFALLMQRGYIIEEERMLAETFGPTWDAYRARVRRWL